MGDYLPRAQILQQKDHIKQVLHLGSIPLPQGGTAWLGQGPFHVGFTNMSQKSIIFFFPSYWVYLSRWLLLNLSHCLGCIDTLKSHRIIPVPQLMLKMFLGKVMSRLPRWHGGKQPAFQCRRCKRFKFHSLVGKIPWRRKWQHSPVFLPGKSHGAYGLQSMGSQRVWLSQAQGNIQCLHNMVPDKMVSEEVWLGQGKSENLNDFTRNVNS